MSSPSLARSSPIARYDALNRCLPSRRAGARLILCCGCIAWALALLSCGSTTQTPQVKPRQARPAAFNPEEFPDIPLPRGYILMLDEPQLAVTVAGGTVRRFDVAMQRRQDLSDQTSSQLLGRLRTDLQEEGWHLDGETSSSQRWSKGAELLLVDTGRQDSRTTIRYRLRPAAQVAPAH